MLPGEGRIPARYRLIRRSIRTASAAIHRTVASRLSQRRQDDERGSGSRSGRGDVPRPSGEFPRIATRPGLQGGSQRHKPLAQGRLRDPAASHGATRRLPSPHRSADRPPNLLVSDIPASEVIRMVSGGLEVRLVEEVAVR